jgi:hypothetical protein
MSRSLFLLAAAAMSVLASATANGQAVLDPAARTMLNMRIDGAIFAGSREARGHLPDLGPKPVEPARIVDELGADLGNELRKILAAADGWGNPMRFIVNPDHYMIISFGADGREDVRYAELVSQEQRGLEPGTAPDVPERDIIFSDGEFLQRPHPKAPPTKQAMADLRSIGTAIESFAVDNDSYPGPTKGLQPIDVLASDLEPIYIRSLPRLDGWGHPYLVWSDSKTYLVVCGGADGVLDVDYRAPQDPVAGLAKDPSVTAGPDADIVFANGQFVRWPRDGERP